MAEGANAECGLQPSVPLHPALSCPWIYDGEGG